MVLQFCCCCFDHRRGVLALAVIFGILSFIDFVLSAVDLGLVLLFLDCRYLPILIYISLKVPNFEFNFDVRFSPSVHWWVKTLCQNQNDESLSLCANQYPTSNATWMYVLTADSVLQIHQNPSRRWVLSFHYAYDQIFPTETWVNIFKLVRFLTLCPMTYFLIIGKKKNLTAQKPMNQKVWYKLFSNSSRCSYRDSLILNPKTSLLDTGHITLKNHFCSLSLLWPVLLSNGCRNYGSGVGNRR